LPDWVPVTCASRIRIRRAHSAAASDAVELPNDERAAAVGLNDLEGAHLSTAELLDHPT
jgi:hypothetical protein